MNVAVKVVQSFFKNMLLSSTPLLLEAAILFEVFFRTQLYEKRTQQKIAVLRTLGNICHATSIMQSI